MAGCVAPLQNSESNHGSHRSSPTRPGGASLCRLNYLSGNVLVVKACKSCINVVFVPPARKPGASMARWADQHSSNKSPHNSCILIVTNQELSCQHDQSVLFSPVRSVKVCYPHPSKSERWGGWGPNRHCYEPELLHLPRSKSAPRSEGKSWQEGKQLRHPGVTLRLSSSFPSHRALPGPWKHPQSPKSKQKEPRTPKARDARTHCQAPWCRSLSSFLPISFPKFALSLTQLAIQKRKKTHHDPAKGFQGFQFPVLSHLQVDAKDEAGRHLNTGVVAHTLLWSPVQKCDCHPDLWTCELKYHKDTVRLTNILLKLSALRLERYPVIRLPGIANSCPGYSEWKAVKGPRCCLKCAVTLADLPRLEISNLRSFSSHVLQSSIVLYHIIFGQHSAPETQRSLHANMLLVLQPWALNCLTCQA